MVKARKLGGSLVVRIPREVVEQEKIIAGETVKIKIIKMKKDGFGLLKGIKPFERKDELDEQV